MSRARFILPVLVVFVASLTLARPAASAAAERAFATEVKVEPASKPDTYLATVEVADAATQEVLAAPKVLVVAGETATVTTSHPHGEQVRVTVEVQRGGGGLTYTVEVRGGDRPLTSHRATIALGRKG